MAGYEFDIIAALDDPTWTDFRLRLLGAANLAHGVRQLRQREKSETGYADHLRGHLALIKDLTPESLAAQADYAVDHRTLMPAQGRSRHKTRTYWLDDPHIQYGKSSFSRCGACEHWSQKGEKVHCKFLNRNGNTQSASYDSPCLLGGAGVLEQARRDLQAELDAHIGRKGSARQKIQAAIARLQRIARDADNLPLLPGFRKTDKESSFLFGDRVLVYSGFAAFADAMQGKWLPATVLRAESAVVILFDEPWLIPLENQTRSSLRVREEWESMWWAMPVRSPFIVTRNELETLIALPETHPLKELWLTVDPEEDGLRDPRYRRLFFHAKPEEFARSLRSWETVVAAAPSTRRLMSAHEAAQTLGFAAIPQDIRTVVEQYRRLRPGAYKQRLHQLAQAKDTLLVRNDGVVFDGGDF